MGAFGVEGEHSVLSLVEGFAAGGIKAAGVFEVFAEAELVEARGHFVVLLVGGGGLLGERTGLEIGDVGGAIIDGGFVADALREETADANAQKPIGEEVFFEERVDHEKRKRFGRLGFFRKPRDEDTRGFLIVPVRFAATAEGLFLGQRDTGDA